MGKKISELPETTILTTGNDIMLVVSNNDTKKVRVSNILKYGNQYNGTDIKSLSSNWEDTYTNVQTNSASWAIDNSTDTEVRSLTSEWNDTYTNVQANSASWAIDNSTDTEVRSLTSNWEDTYTNVQANSASYVTFTHAQNNYLPLSGGSMSGDISATNIFLTNAIVNTKTPPLTITDDYLIINVNGVNKAIRLYSL